MIQTGDSQSVVLLQVAHTATLTDRHMLWQPDRQNRGRLSSSCTGPLTGAAQHCAQMQLCTCNHKGWQSHLAGGHGGLAPSPEP